jgi:uncharacterized protein (TIGR00255 family)
MTGFGKAEVEYGGKKISIEIKSLNSKQLDINTRIPNVYREKELEIRNLIQTALERGKVEVTLTVDNAAKTSNLINTAAVKSYYEEILELSKNLGIEMPSDWFSVILKQPDATKTGNQALNNEEWETLKSGIEEALNSLNNFRIQEGLMLENVFRNKITTIENLIPDVERYENDRIDKLKTRINENLAKSGIEEPFDCNRFEQELFYYIERLDINEEKSRLTNHLKYFIETMEDHKSQGRKLGFIAQEIGREINTLGSKSNHAEMQQTVVRMKDELEQIKEQVLNVL